MDIYREWILEHYKNPQNFGEELPDATHSFEDGNPSCGDHLAVQLKIQNDRIEDIRFRGQGCAISIASASILSEHVKGKSLEEVRNLTKDEFLKLLGIPLSPIRLKCALLSFKVLKAALYGLDRARVEVGE